MKPGFTSLLKDLWKPLHCFDAGLFVEVFLDYPTPPTLYFSVLVSLGTQGTRLCISTSVAVHHLPISVRFSGQMSSIKKKLASH
jgi:hypothetical protein